MKISEIKRLIVSARNSQIKANAKMAVVLHNLESNIGIDLENIPNNSAENADNLASAIMCAIARDVRKTIYWAAAAVLNLSVTF